MAADEPEAAACLREPLEQLLTTAELARMLQVTERTLRRWRKEGCIEAVRIGRTVRFRLSDVALR